jgi:hypothetical protein
LEVTTTSLNEGLVPGEPLLDGALVDDHERGKMESTCNNAEEDHENYACCKGGHIVEGKIVGILVFRS